MGFQTPLYELTDYLKWAESGKIQLPDFQRGYKWEDERIRQLLVTVLREPTGPQTFHITITDGTYTATDNCWVPTSGT
ncbi:hypothetical protein ACWDTD_18515 [Gordonia sp. NPDC003425]